MRGIHRSPVNSPHKWPVTRKSIWWRHHGLFFFEDYFKWLRTGGQSSGSKQIWEFASGNWTNSEVLQDRHKEQKYFHHGQILSGAATRTCGNRQQHWSGPFLLTWNNFNPSKDIVTCPVKFRMKLLIHSQTSASMSHPFSSRNTSLGFAGGKHCQKIIIPIFRLVLQNFAIPGCFPYILFYRYPFSLLSWLVCYCSLWLYYSPGN